ncbi:MFS transporter [Geothrix limicola]|uniref:MFS transporter n=1 Tax=Geothrix limicola TaxID=2927978 RepID=A0ABQ5QGY0_9BACT|nr:MFS transporter [Geothrix limicola]GLH73943.1 MFS transporter [Geothrix limicola]
MARTDAPKNRLLTAPFLVLCCFYFLVFAAGYQLFPVVPLRLRELGASLAESGRFQTAFMLGSGFGSLFTGPMGDRLGPRRVLRVASFAVVAILLVYALLRVRWVFYLLAPLHGLLWSALRTASVAKVGVILSHEHRAQGLSLFGLTGPGGVAVGPLVGLWLMPHLGFAWMLVLLAGVFVLLHLLIGSLPRESSREIQSAAFQWPDRAVWGTVAVMTLVGLGFGPMPPYSAQEAKALGMALPATFLTCFALGMMAIRGLLALTGMGRRPVSLLPYMIALASAGYALLAFLPGGMIRHLLAGLIYGAGYGMVHTLLLMDIFATTPHERTGAAVGALFFAFDAATAFGALGLGWVMEHSGFRHGWAIGAVLMALSIPVARRIVRRSAAMTTEPDPSGILEG